MPGAHQRVHVNPKLCEGHALCIDLAPDVFVLSDDDVASAIADPADALSDSVTAAVNACPRGAITINSD